METVSFTSIAPRENINFFFNNDFILHYQILIEIQSKNFLLLKEKKTLSMLAVKGNKWQSQMFC